MKITKSKLKEALNTLGIFPKSSLTKEEFMQEFYHFFDKDITKFLTMINIKIYFLIAKLLQAGPKGIDVELSDEFEVNFLDDILLIQEPIITEENIHIQLNEQMKDRLAKLILPKNEKMVRENQSIIDFIIHSIDTYGIIEDYEMAHMVTKFLNIQIDDIAILKLLAHQIDLRYHLSVTEFNDTFYLVNAFINQPEDLIMERESRNLSYKNYTLQELSINIWDKIYKLKETQELLKFLEKREVEFAEEAILSIALIIMSSPPLDAEDFMNFIKIEFKDIDEANEYLQLVIDLHNSIPHYSLYGYSPKELTQMYKEKMEHKKPEKIGRNDPCPCGSGKKYKNCCLNKVIAVNFNRETPKDCVKEEYAKQFFALKSSLFNYTNQKYHINPDLKNLQDISDAQPEEVIKIRDKIWKDPHVIQDYIKENPYHLLPEDLAIMEKWNQKKIEKEFVLYKYEKEFTIFMDDNAIYYVKGLKERIRNIIPEHQLPIFVETVLLPFHDQIIYDSYLLQYSLSFGKGMKNMLNNSYHKMLENKEEIYQL